jgi:hypothetical protein
MNLSDYFEKTEGTGILGTADINGNVDAAIYARPHVIDEKTVAFIMNERLSYQNITANPKAAYLFLEDCPGYKGKRLYLSKFLRAYARSILEFKLRLSAVFLTLHLDVSANRCFIYSNCRYEVTYRPNTFYSPIHLI